MDHRQPPTVDRTQYEHRAARRGDRHIRPAGEFFQRQPRWLPQTSPDGQRLLAREGAGWTFVRGRDAQDRRLLGQHLGQTAQWHPDSRFLGWEPHYGTVGFDVETNRRLGMLFPWLTGDHWLCIGPTGHYRGSPGVEDQFVYVAMLPDGSQRTYTPAEFAEKFGWKNDPEKAELLGTNRAASNQCIAIRSAYRGEAKSRSTTFSYAAGDESSMNADSSLGDGGKPVKSRVTRRSHVALSVSIDGVSPSASSRFNTNRSIAFRAQSVRVTFGN